MTALLDQPPHALLEGEHAESERGGGDELQADGDLPLPGGRREAGFDSVVAPVGDQDTDGEEELEEAADTAAQLARRHLAAVHGHNDRGTAESQPGNDARDVEGGQRVRVDGLDEGANAEDK